LPAAIIAFFFAFAAYFVARSTLYFRPDPFDFLAFSSSFFAATQIASAAPLHPRHSPRRMCNSYLA
jgi:hypothetical protein